MVKHRRGGGLNVAWSREANWPVFDRNEEEDLTIRTKSLALQADYEGLMADAEVRALHERSCRLYAAHIDALMCGVSMPDRAPGRA